MFVSPLLDNFDVYVYYSFFYSFSPPLSFSSCAPYFVLCVFRWYCLLLTVLQYLFFQNIWVGAPSITLLNSYMNLSNYGSYIYIVWISNTLSENIIVSSVNWWLNSKVDECHINGVINFQSCTRVSTKEMNTAWASVRSRQLSPPLQASKVHEDLWFLPSQHAYHLLPQLRPLG